MGSWIKTIVRKKKLHRTNSVDAEQGKDKRSRWRLWKSSRGSIDLGSNPADEKDATVVSEDAEHVDEENDHALEELAAIRIQTAFRGYLARRTLRALKGLARLQARINRNGVNKQSVASLRPIRDFIRIQAQIHMQRVLKRQDPAGGLQKLPAQATGASEKTSEAEWCDAVGTLEEIKAKKQQRHEAAIKRERAMAYAFSNQWRINAKLNSDHFFDYEFNNSTWSWIWLDRWISSRPESGFAPKDSKSPNLQDLQNLGSTNGSPTTKVAVKKTPVVSIKKNSKVVSMPNSETTDSTQLKSETDINSTPENTTTTTRKLAPRKRSPKTRTQRAIEAKKTSAATESDAAKIHPTKSDTDLSAEEPKVEVQN